MNQPDFHLLSLVIFLPLCGAVVTLFLRKDTAIKWWALIVTVANFFISLPLYFAFQSGTAEMQFVEHVPWMPDLGVSYHLGIDGISLFLVLLTTFLTPVAVLSSWTYITERVKEYMIFMLLMETSMVGVFAALDLILFYVFWEATLIPMYFLIGIWGGKRRIYAAVKFFLYTLAGSALMLVAIFVLYFMNARATGQPTFDLLELQKFSVPLAAQKWLFLAFALGFAIKVPLFPFHTWLPDAHVQAPTAGSVILAGVLLKMGAYGFIRFCLPLFPAAFAYFVPLMSILAIIGIIYGSLVAFSQSDIKSLVAYSSVSHLGFVVLGIFALNAQGLSGGILQMVNHGLSTGALFLLVGMLYERRHTRLIDDFGGLWKQLPLFGIFLLIVTLSSIGLPGLNGFIGEFTILVGTFQANWIYAALAATGIVLGAWYMLTMFRRVMHGPLDKPINRQLQDLSAREIIVLVPVVVLIFLIGLFPNLFFDKMQSSVDNLLSQTSITISMGEPHSQ
ncbi:MAG: NADH-quinone oxidoreductase subunit M [Anaerolineales bacterium]|nr:MAG: NADH-quinone oxidoreductase subunit M [Anaerolineales bacterium]